MVVADAIAVGRNGERGHALHEARGEPTQAAVAQRRVGLELAQPIEVDAQIAQRRAGGLGQAQITERVEEQAADQEFEREVVDTLASVVIGLARSIHPAVDDLVADGKSGGDEPVVFEGVARILADGIGEPFQNRLAKRRDGVRRRNAGRVVDLCGRFGEGGGGFGNHRNGNG